MGASREDQDIWDSIRSRDWKKLKKQLSSFLPNRSKWIRECVIKDSFITPFNKKIGCRIFKHRWCTKEEIDRYDLYEYVCWKCNKRESIDSRKSNERDEKLKSIIG